jgi:hypothetical protein
MSHGRHVPTSLLQECRESAVFSTTLFELRTNTACHTLLSADTRSVAKQLWYLHTMLAYTALPASAVVQLVKPSPLAKQPPHACIRLRVPPAAQMWSLILLKHLQVQNIMLPPAGVIMLLFLLNILFTRLLVDRMGFMVRSCALCSRPTAVPELAACGGCIVDNKLEGVCGRTA